MVKKQQTGGKAKQRIRVEFCGIAGTPRAPVATLLDVVKHAGYWLRDDSGNLTRTMRHICWDGCMFPNAVMEQQQTWNAVLGTMIRVRDAHGWRE